MKEEHVISLLEQYSISSLGTGELAIIETHTAACAACRQSHEAAQLALLLLRERAAVVTAPSPLFPSRVLAALATTEAVRD